MKTGSLPRPLHDGRLHGHPEDVGVVEVQIWASRRFHIGERTHDAPHQHANKNEDQHGAATSKPNVDPMAELKMFFPNDMPQI